MRMIEFDQNIMTKKRAQGAIDTGLPNPHQVSKKHYIASAENELKRVLEQVRKIKGRIMQCRKKKGSGGLKDQIDIAYARGCGGGHITDQWITKFISPRVNYGQRSKVRGHVWALFYLGRKFSRICDQAQDARF